MQSCPFVLWSANPAEGGTAALSLLRRALESVTPEDDKIFYYQRDSTGGCSHATSEGASSGEWDNDEPEDDEPEIVDPKL